MYAVCIRRFVPVSAGRSRISLSSSDAYFVWFKQGVWGPMSLSQQAQHSSVLNRLQSRGLHFAVVARGLRMSYVPRVVI